MSATLTMPKKKPEKAQPTDDAEAPGDDRKGMTFRLNDKDLAYKLRMVLADLQQSAAAFIEPIIKEVVELKYDMLKEKIGKTN